MAATFGVVDLFAGPGGLSEGFAGLKVGRTQPFHLGISVEKEASAHRTLRLRSFLRLYQQRHGLLPSSFIDFHAGLISQPDWEALDRTAWRQADEEAKCLELGTASATDAIDAAIRNIRKRYDDTILIGGPPCQAYSVVGRARSRGTPGYVAENDNRHYLFREYIHVLDRLRPAAFVMENVKGMLSSTVESRLVFEMLMEDLSSVGGKRGGQYVLRAIRVEDATAGFHEVGKASDFVVRSEQFGIPQRRHRVIIVGLRSDVAARASATRLKLQHQPSTVEEAIGSLKPLRSGVSKAADGPAQWRSIVLDAATHLTKMHRESRSADLRAGFADLARRLSTGSPAPRSSSVLSSRYGQSRNALRAWLERPALRAVAQHNSRSHMAPDLQRYMFAAVFGAVRGFSPKALDFPDALTPDHRNWHSGDFADRFRVQLASEPSTTITSHISKDGHYFIHPDPAQCRSMTVREAARLQTFPDDYLFLGNRTEQYVQVGNAVPPLLALQIAELLHLALDGAGKRGS